MEVMESIGTELHDYLQSVIKDQCDLIRACATVAPVLCKAERTYEFAFTGEFARARETDYGRVGSALSAAIGATVEPVIMSSRENIPAEFSLAVSDQPLSSEERDRINRRKGTPFSAALRRKFDDSALGQSRSGEDARVRVFDLLGRRLQYEYPGQGWQDKLQNNIDWAYRRLLGGENTEQLRNAVFMTVALYLTAEAAGAEDYARQLMPLALLLPLVAPLWLLPNERVRGKDHPARRQSFLCLVVAD